MRVRGGVWGSEKESCDSGAADSLPRSRLQRRESWAWNSGQVRPGLGPDPQVWCLDTNLGASEWRELPAAEGAPREPSTGPQGGSAPLSRGARSSPPRRGFKNSPSEIQATGTFFSNV